MYRDPVQWKQIRDRVLRQGISQRQVAIEQGMDRHTVARIVAHETPPPRKKRDFFRPVVGPHELTIKKMAAKRLGVLHSGEPTIADIYRYIRSVEGYAGSYTAVRDFVATLKVGPLPAKVPPGIWGYAFGVLSTAGHTEGPRLLRAMSNGHRTGLSEEKLRRLARVATKISERKSRVQSPQLFQDKQEQWLHALAAGVFSEAEIRGCVGEIADMTELLEITQSGNRISRNRALSVLASKSGMSFRATAKILKIDRKSCRRYLDTYSKLGAAGLLQRKPASNRKVDDERLKNVLFALLHEPPSNYNINRTTWRMADLKAVLSEKGHPACEDVIRSIIKKAGYRWRKARVVLTSRDPEYSEKLKAIQDILSNLTSNELFFSIDEFGPFSVKMKGGRSLVGPGQTPVVPQWQKSKGCLILTAALELSTNQVTHFYSKRKNTNEMIKLIDILVDQYAGKEKLFLSWDAASWHMSKNLQAHIDEHNNTCRLRGLPLVQLAPLPSGAQFLNVIESVFSGMAKAIIHNSNYSSADEAKAAIDRYFEERNAKFEKNPKRAGKKIWGAEREPAGFCPSRNHKDPRYQ